MFQIIMHVGKRAPSETKPISNDESSAWNVFLILTIMQDAMTQRLISNMSMSFESNIRNYQCLGRNMLLPCLSFRNPGIWRLNMLPVF